MRGSAFQGPDQPIAASRLSVCFSGPRHPTRSQKTFSRKVRKGRKEKAVAGCRHRVCSAVDAGRGLTVGEPSPPAKASIGSPLPSGIGQKDRKPQSRTPAHPKAEGIFTRRARNSQVVWLTGLPIRKLFPTPNRSFRSGSRPRIEKVTFIVFSHPKLKKRTKAIRPCRLLSGRHQGDHILASLGSPGRFIRDVSIGISSDPNGM